jgi:hypothetical protein
MFIDKIQVFQGENKAELPCILIHVSQPLAQPVEVSPRDDGKNITREVQEQEDGKHVLRVYKFRANL